MEKELSEMDIRFIFNPYSDYPNLKLEWYIIGGKEEDKFVEEIKQEIALDIQEQYGGEILW